ncbi:MAG: hypothetical protein ACYC6Y_26725, partial [Thermoguttaceae bacterium]
MRCHGHRFLPLLLTFVGVSAHAEVGSSDSIDRQALLRRCAEGEDRLWQPVAVHDPEGSLSCRSLFSSAMALCEARRDADRLSRLYELAARFQ